MKKEQWTTMPSEEVLNATVKAMRERDFNVIVVADKAAALEKIKSLIPKGSEVMNGSSATLSEMGYTDFLKSGKHGWKNLHEEIFKEKDPAKQSDIRRKAAAAEYMLASVNAISQNGEIVAVDASGSRVSSYAYAGKNVIIVAGIQKITKSLDDAMRRIREYVLPLEDARALKAYGVHSAFGKWLILEREFAPNRMTVILVREKLGF
jgi:hypothetical protein